MLCSSALETYSVRPLGESAIPRGRPADFATSVIGTFWRDVIHAVEIEFAVFALLPKRGIREVDVPVPATTICDGAFSFLPSQAVGQHLDLAVLFGARDTPGTGFTRVQAALRVEGISRGTVGIVR